MAIIKGRNGPQLRGPRKDGWTLKRRKIFLDTLAATCHVGRSEAAAGKGQGSAYHLKKRDGEFAALWAQALAEGTERLEEQLLAHTMGASSGDNPQGEREVIEVPPFDPKMALQVLKWRRDYALTIRRPRKRTGATQAEVDLALMTALEELAGKLGENGS